MWRKREYRGTGVGSDADPGSIPSDGEEFGSWSIDKSSSGACWVPFLPSPIVGEWVANTGRRDAGKRIALSDLPSWRFAISEPVSEDETGPSSMSTGSFKVCARKADRQPRQIHAHPELERLGRGSEFDPVHLHLEPGMNDTAAGDNLR